MNCDCGALDCPSCRSFHMERRRYELPYQDPGQRRPWVPYHEWLARREAERRRVPGVFRQDRARRAEDVRAGVRFPREARFQQERGGRARERMTQMSEEELELMYERQLQEKRDKWRRMHRDAARIYDVDGPEERFDIIHGDYGGRYEEFVYQGQEEAPEEAFKRLREDDDVADLPVLDPKKVKFVDE